jgi:hypothetical protein
MHKSSGNEMPLDRKANSAYTKSVHGIPSCFLMINAVVYPNSQEAPREKSFARCAGGAFLASYSIGTNKKPKP